MYSALWMHGENVAPAKRRKSVALEYIMKDSM
jgi:hypothetical protein